MNSCDGHHNAFWKEFQDWGRRDSQMTTISSSVLLLTMSAEPFNCEGLFSLIRKIDQIVASASSPVMSVMYLRDQGYSHRSSPFHSLDESRGCKNAER